MWRNWVIVGLFAALLGAYSWGVFVPRGKLAEPTTTIRERYVRDREYRTREVFPITSEDPMSPDREAAMRRSNAIRAATKRERDRVSSTPRVSSGGYSSGRSYGGIGSGK